MASMTKSSEGDAFAFADHNDLAARAVDNLSMIVVAPWRAWWAFTFETLNPENYRL
jgi:hypothetical protein